MASPEHFQWQGGIFQRRQRRQQLEILKDEADVTTTKGCTTVLVETAETLAHQRHLALGRPVETCEQSQQRRFSRTRWTDYRDAVTRVDAEIDILQNDQRTRARGDGTTELAGFNDSVLGLNGWCGLGAAILDVLERFLHA